MNVEELVLKHKSDIEALKVLVESRFGILGEKEVFTEVDEIFYLRFVLSNEDEVKRTEHVFATISYRLKHRDELEDSYVNQRCNKSDVLLKYSKVGFQGTVDDNPAFIVRVGHCNIRKIAKEMTKNEIVHCMLMLEETAFQLCDKLTRETRTVTKLYSIFDMAKFNVFSFSLPFFMALGRVSHLSHMYYPQMIGLKIFVNVPNTMRRCMHLFNKFQHKKSVEKQVICGKTPSTKCGEICPFLTNRTKFLPLFLGGESPIIDERLNL